METANCLSPGCSSSSAHSEACVALAICKPSSLCHRCHLLLPAHSHSHQWSPSCPQGPASPTQWELSWRELPPASPALWDPIYSAAPGLSFTVSLPDLVSPHLPTITSCPRTSPPLPHRRASQDRFLPYKFQPRLSPTRYLMLLCFFSPCEYPGIPAPFAQKTLIFSLSYFDTFMKNHVSENLFLDFGFSSPLDHSFLMLKPHSLGTV